MEIQKLVIQTNRAPKPVAPYSQAIALGNLLFCSGQIGLDPQTGKLVSDDIAEQAGQVLLNLTAILEEAGLTRKDVVKVTVFLTDMKDFAAVNEVYSNFFTAPYPARTAFSVTGLPLGARVEIEAIAHFH